MLIRPKDYHVLGTDIRLDKNKVYLAEPATNQPDRTICGTPLFKAIPQDAYEEMMEMVRKAVGRAVDKQRFSREDLSHPKLIEKQEDNRSLNL